MIMYHAPFCIVMMITITNNLSDKLPEFFMYFYSFCEIVGNTICYFTDYPDRCENQLGM